MKKVKVYIEKSEYGFSAYMDDTSLSYGLFGEGKTVEETIEDFNLSYQDFKKIYAEWGKPFEEIEYEFFYDVASFLQEYCEAFSLAGLVVFLGTITILSNVSLNTGNSACKWCTLKTISIFEFLRNDENLFNSSIVENRGRPV